ncbi:uncharacterized protein CDAR_593751 [Caerostris darwini]|uniref:Uncharacterized protein n=1 Tax=Caerostris darwini TaxID=1538125 RepID=A0AAV4TT73_9ARAC|nr:uncharacterized protein CDAR_593751 [Caerostris darwini]
MFFDVSSLQHLTLVKISLTLCKNPRILDVMKLNACHDKDHNKNEILFRSTRDIIKLKIPLILKKKLLRYIASIICEYQEWLTLHAGSLGAEVQPLAELYWKSDGSIHKQKSVEVLLRDKSIDITYRFRMACEYCMKDDIVALWNEMSEAKQNDEIFKINTYLIRGWLYWLRNKDKTDWPNSSENVIFKSLLLGNPFNKRAVPNLLKLLTPEDRHLCLLKHLKTSSFLPIDINLYLELDESEREDLLQKNYLCILNTFFKWSSPSIFLKLADKFFAFFENNHFCFCVRFLLLKINSSWLDLSYVNLFKEFWNSCPIHLKEAVMAEDELYADIKKLLYGRHEAQVNSTFETFENWLANSSPSTNRPKKFIQPSFDF